MTFKVLLHPKAAKELEKIEKLTRERIIESSKELRVNPSGVGRRLSQSDFWSLRVGDYRVIYEINREESQVVILSVGHRSNVHDELSKVF